jgi:DNA-binding response OmpR family regulator
VRDPALILVADDNPSNLDILAARLTASGFAVITAEDGAAALSLARAERPDLVLLDVMMPKVDGLEVARRLKSDKSLPFMPIIHVTAKVQTEDVVAGLDAGADEYLTKPIDHMALLARVRSLLRIKALHDRVDAQASELAAWNVTLTEKVESQVAELERLSRLKRFLSPQVAEVVLSSQDHLLASHRREIVVVFCDLRGFSAFSEVAEPEDVMALLRSYHQAAGILIERHEATLERFTGDGLMLFFNDPMPCPDPALRAVNFAMDLRRDVDHLLDKFRQLGQPLGFGIGIAQGYATLGRVGFDGRSDYAAVGTVVNLGARLCDLAQDSEILVTQRVAAACAERLTTEVIGDKSLAGLRQPVQVHRVVSLNASDG